MINASGTRTVSPIVANDAIDVLSLAWDNRGPGPQTIVLIFTAQGLPPSNPTITLQIFPTGAIAVGTDSSGNISVLKTLTNTGDDKNYSVSGGGNVNLADGFWDSQLRAILAYNPSEAPNAAVTFNVQIGAFDPTDPAEFTLDATLNPPTNVAATEPVYDPESGQFTFTLSWDNNELLPVVIITEPSPSGFQYVEGSSQSPAATFPERFTNEEPPVSTWMYTFYYYSYTPSRRISPASSVLIVNIPGAPTPDITIIGSGGVTLGGIATAVFIGDPSGIYTLEEGKLHDTIINRVGATVEELNLAIPRPFVRTGPF